MPISSGSMHDANDRILPLCHAVLKNNASAARILVSFGADPYEPFSCYCAGGGDAIGMAGDNEQLKADLTRFLLHCKQGRKKKDFHTWQIYFSFPKLSLLSLLASSLAKFRFFPILTDM